MVLENGLFTATPALDDQNRTIVSPDKLFTITPWGSGSSSDMLAIIDDDTTTKYTDGNVIGTSANQIISSTESTILTWNNNVNADILWVTWGYYWNTAGLVVCNSGYANIVTWAVETSINNIDWTTLDSYVLNISEYSANKTGQRNISVANKKFKYIRFRITVSIQVKYNSGGNLDKGTYINTVKLSE